MGGELNLVLGPEGIWFGREPLLTSPDWEREVLEYMEGSRFVVILLSKRALQDTALVQEEIAYVLEGLTHFSPGRILAIPARLEECEPSCPELRGTQRVDLFPDWAEGFRQIVVAIRTAAMTELPPGRLDRPAVLYALHNLYLGRTALHFLHGPWSHDCSRGPRYDKEKWLHLAHLLADSDWDRSTTDEICDLVEEQWTISYEFRRRQPCRSEVEREAEAEVWRRFFNVLEGNILIPNTKVQAA